MSSLSQLLNLPAAPGSNGHGPHANGKKKWVEPKFATPDQVGATETLVDVFALIGDALVLNNGTFVRMLEVAPIDLERVDSSLKERYWAMFSNALRRFRAPLGVQIVVSTRPQDLTPYLSKWENQAHEWQRLAEAAADSLTMARRQRMGRSAVETAAFLTAAHERLCPMQQRYFVVITHNPFPEAHTKKTQTRLLNDEVVAEALEKLDDHVQVVRAAFGEVGLPMFDLDGGAMCQAIWEHYHHPCSVLGGGLSPQIALQAPGDSPLTARPAVSQCPSPDAYLEAAQDAERLADLLAPALVEEHAHYLRVGEVVARGYILYDFDPRTPVDFASLLTFQADMTHALYITAADPVAIRQLFKEKETELKAASVTDARRGTVTDWGRQAAIQSIESMRAEMEMALQSPFFLHWHCLIWANDLSALEKRCQAFESILKVRDIRFYPATRRQVSILQSTRPLARMTYATKPRNMSADSLGPFFPFARREYFDPSGWHFGVHRGSGLFVCLNPFEEGQSNASQLIIGTPGSGKSVYIKQMIETLLALGDRVFVIDPEREYLRMAADLHATYVELGKRSEPRRLMLDPSNPQGFLGGLVEAGELYETLTAEPLTRPQMEALGAAYVAAMTNAGILADDLKTWSRPAPLIDDLIKALIESSQPEAQEVARVLGYASALDGGHGLNIMDINLNSENPWQAAAESLAAFVEAILGHPMDSYTFNALVDAYQVTMEKWGFHADERSSWETQRSRTPTLSHLVDTLAADRKPQSQDLAAVLKQYAYGLYAGLFNTRTTVDLSGSPFVVFGMRSLRENVERTLTPVFAWQVLRLVWNEVVSLGAAQNTHLIIDEAWYVLEQPGAATRLERMARSFRKYNAALHLATHDIQKLMASPEARVIAEIGRVKMLFGQESESAVRSLAEVFGVTPPEQADLLRLGKGEGLLLMNDLRLPLYVPVNPLRLKRLATNREQQQAVARASGRKGQPVL